MRTTLDIDEDVLQAAKELARREHRTAGQVLSDLARRALTTPSGDSQHPSAVGLILKNGFYVLAGREGALVTNELVSRLLNEADREDAGLPKDG